MRQVPLGREFGLFLRFVYGYTRKRLMQAFKKFEFFKGILVERLYQKRGKYVRPFMHSGMMMLMFVGISLGPLVIDQFSPELRGVHGEDGYNMLVQETGVETETLLSEKPRAEILEYTVQEGDTLGGVADKFGVSLETVLWANSLESKSKIKPGEKIKVPPVTGVAHKVKRGETIYSIAKKYDVEAQSIINWPFNSYANDETFALAVGQIVMVPEGVMPKAVISTSRQYGRLTPDAGSVAATGVFVWPTAGRLTQYPAWYHMAIDIANKAAPDVLAADAGKIVVAGRPDGYGYGMRVVIDHGNGFQTLYAHLSGVYVNSGQTVTRGAAIGKMGSTGRSTGIHLHFEVLKNGVLVNPLNYLK